MPCATLCVHFPLAPRRKHDNAIAPLWMHFPLAQRRKPTTPSHLDQNAIYNFLNAIPPNTLSSWNLYFLSLSNHFPIEISIYCYFPIEISTFCHFLRTFLLKSLVSVTF